MTPSSRQSSSTVRKCCSASVSVGAISAPWKPLLDRAQQRVERDHRLARADVALEQPLHRHRAGEVAVDLGDRPLLVRGQLERQRLAVARDQLAGLAERGRDLLLALARPAREAELEQEQLVERKAPATLLRLLERPRTVQRVERVGARAEDARVLQPRRERVRVVARRARARGRRARASAAA